MIQYVHASRCVCVYIYVCVWVDGWVIVFSIDWAYLDVRVVIKCYETTQISQHWPLRLKGLTNHSAMLCSTQTANKHAHTYIYTCVSTCVCICVPVFFFCWDCDNMGTSRGIKWTLNSNEVKFSHLLRKAWAVLVSTLWYLVCVTYSLFFGKSVGSGVGS